MNILKKISGAIILLFAILLCFPAVYAFPIQFGNCIKKFEEGVTGAPGYAIGFVIYVLILYFLIKLSLKLIKKKKIDVTSIGEIGIE